MTISSSKQYLWKVIGGFLQLFLVLVVACIKMVEEQENSGEATSAKLNGIMDSQQQVVGYILLILLLL